MRYSILALVFTLLSFSASAQGWQRDTVFNIDTKTEMPVLYMMNQDNDVLLYAFMEQYFLLHGFPPTENIVSIETWVDGVKTMPNVGVYIKEQGVVVISGLSKLVFGATKQIKIKAKSRKIVKTFIFYVRKGRVYKL